MKGLIPAGGAGTRLYPLTQAVCKQLLPVGDRPMICYPLDTLLRAGIRDVLIVSTPDDTPRLQALLGDGESFGARLSYAVQPGPDGVAQALIIGGDFIAGDCVTMALGDNLFFGDGLYDKLKSAVRRAEAGDGATIFAKSVDDPRRFGVVTLDADGKPVAISEKPERPESLLCVTGLYVYDARAVGYAKRLTPSERGELEISDVNRAYLNAGALCVERLEGDVAWFDAGTPESLEAARRYVCAHDGGGRTT